MRHKTYSGQQGRGKSKERLMFNWNDIISFTTSIVSRGKRSENHSLILNNADDTGFYINSNLRLNLQPTTYKLLQLSWCLNIEVAPNAAKANKPNIEVGSGTGVNIILSKFTSPELAI